MTHPFRIWHVVWPVKQKKPHINWRIRNQNDVYYKASCDIKVIFSKRNIGVNWHYFWFLKTSRDTLGLNLNVKWNIHTVSKPLKDCHCLLSHTNNSRRNYLNSDSQHHHRLRCTAFSPPGVTIELKMKAESWIPIKPCFSPLTNSVSKQVNRTKSENRSQVLDN